MTLECRILRKIDETAEGYNIVAEIVNILVDENYLGEDGKPQVEKMNLMQLMKQRKLLNLVLQLWMH